MRDSLSEKSFSNVTPFWQRLPQFFLYPMQQQLIWRPVLYALLGSGLYLLGRSGEDDGFSPVILIVAVLVGIGLSIDLMRQAFRILEQTSLGNLRYADFDKPDDMHKMTPYKLYFVMLVQGFFQRKWIFQTWFSQKIPSFLHVKSGFRIHILKTKSN